MLLAFGVQCEERFKTIEFDYVWGVFVRQATLAHENPSKLATLWGNIHQRCEASQPPHSPLDPATRHRAAFTLYRIICTCWSCRPLSPIQRSSKWMPSANRKRMSLCATLSLIIFIFVWGNNNILRPKKKNVCLRCRLTTMIGRASVCVWTTNWLFDKQSNVQPVFTFIYKRFWKDANYFVIFIL